MKFVGSTVDQLLELTECNGDIRRSAERLVDALDPIGEPFDVPWTYQESLEVFADKLPRELRARLENPGSRPAENHLEACAVALALEAGVRLQPLSKSDMQRLQHTVVHATNSPEWGRRSSYPWDRLANACLEQHDFFGVTVPV
ncbi:MAG: hypothetical protein ACR2P0_08485 [Acidimicrobiales bacterium]